MCWTGRLKKKIATEDINVFKIVLVGDEKRESPRIISYYHRGFEWTLGKQAPKAEIKIPWYKRFFYGYGSLYFGYHSYNSEKFRIVRGNYYLSVKNCPMSHDYPYTYTDGRDVKVMTCIIPKGTTYLENSHGEIISETIKPLKCD